LFNAPKRFGCDICPCKQIAGKPRFLSISAKRCTLLHVAPKTSTSEGQGNAGFPLLITEHATNV
jgi:hypothetical protein